MIANGWRVNGSAYGTIDNNSFGLFFAGDIDSRPLAGMLTNQLVIQRE